MTKDETLADIDKQIAETQAALTNVHGAECEVYARIVGYYRSVKNWNKGKKEEYGIRSVFDQTKAEEHCDSCAVQQVRRRHETL